jgi:hypothetical protein
MRRLITAVRFEEAGVVVEFDEVYPNRLIRQQVLIVPFDGDYLDEVMAMQAAIEALVDDVLEDTTLMRPLTLEELQDAAIAEDSDDGITMNGGS